MLPKLPARLCNILAAGLGFEASGLLSGLGRRAWASLLCFCFGSNGRHSGWRLALSSWPCALSALQYFLFALLNAFSCSFGVGPFFELWKMMCFNYPWFEPGSGGYCRVNLPIYVIQAVTWGPISYSPQVVVFSSLTRSHLAMGSLPTAGRSLSLSPLLPFFFPAGEDMR